MDLNGLLDRLPRTTLRIGDRLVPTYIATGCAGVTCATLTIAALALVCGRDLVVALALVPASVAAFVIASLLRRAIVGRENHVLWEGVLVTLATAWLVAVAAGVEPLEYVDLAAAGLAPLLACGRLGCTMTGCCHGVPARIGIRYPRECKVEHRRLPVQLVELAAWLAIAGVACVLVATGAPGAATAWLLVAYGVVRLALEPLRGDVRWRLAGATEGSLLSGAAIVAGVAVVAHDVELRVLAVGGGALALGVVLAATSRWWLSLPARPDLEERAHLARLGAALADTPVRNERIGRYVVATEPSDVPGAPCLILTVSSDAPLAAAEAALVLEEIAVAAGLARGPLQPVEVAAGHRVILDAAAPAATPATRRSPGYFERPS